MTESGKGRPDDARPRRRPRRDGFGAAKRQRFLDALSLTCNVTRSADAAGIDHATVYYHRARDPVFAEQWQAALSTGYDRLEALLLEHGGAGVALQPADPTRAEAAGDAIPFDFDRALKLLHFARSPQGGGRRGGGARAGDRATREETNAAILLALDAAERRTARHKPAPVLPPQVATTDATGPEDAA